MKARELVDELLRLQETENTIRLSERIDDLNNLIQPCKDIFKSGKYFEALKMLNDCYNIARIECPEMGYWAIMQTVRWDKLFSDGEYEFYYCIPLPLVRMRILPQYKVGKYYVDFLIPKLRLVIEIDGKQHSEYDHVMKDLERDECLRTDYGLKVIRFTAQEVFYFLDPDYNISEYDRDRLNEHPTCRHKLDDIMDRYKYFESIEV